MKKNINDVRELLNKKNPRNEIEKEKKEYLKELFENDDLFFQLKIETAISILHFLEIPDEDILNFYYELVSPENFNKDKGFIIVK